MSTQADEAALLLGALCAAAASCECTLPLFVCHQCTPAGADVCVAEAAWEAALPRYVDIMQHAFGFVSSVTTSLYFEMSWV